MPDIDPETVPGLLSALRRAISEPGSFTVRSYFAVPQQWEDEYDWMARSLLDIPRLLEAVEAVLSLHQPGRYVVQGSMCKRHESYPFFSITAAEAGHVEACFDCSAVVYVSCTGCAGSPDIKRCTTRAAITKALTRETSTDGN